MSGGFFRGTSADQDTRFSNKQAKLLKTQKFAAELDHLVDITRVKMDVIKPWIAKRVTELLGFEDEVLINFIYGLLEGKEVNGKEVQIHLTGFMEKHTGKFMKELWNLLLSAQKNASGVPQQFLDAKEEETKRKKEESDRIVNEIQKRKDKESKELEEEKLKMDGVVAYDSASEPHLMPVESRLSGALSDDEKEAGARNGFRGRNRDSGSPPADSSTSPPRGVPSRSFSKSFSKSRSYSAGRNRSRSVSGSPQSRRRSISSERIYHSPQRRSVTPRRRHSPRESLSPWQKSSHSRRRSASRSRYRSPSLSRRMVRSPIRRRSPSPMQRRSPSPLLRQSPSLERRRSRLPLRRRSPSPWRHRSPSPWRRRSLSPWRHQSRSPRWRRSPSPRQYRSRTPSRRRRRRSPSTISPSPVRRRSPSPVRRRSPSPVRRRSPTPVRHRSPTPVRRRSAFVRHRSPSPVGDKSISPIRGRSPARVRLRRSPSPVRGRSASPGDWSSPSHVRRRSPPLRRKSPKLQRSLDQSPDERSRNHEQLSPTHYRSQKEKAEPSVEVRRRLDSMTSRHPISLSPQRDQTNRNARKRLPSVSPSPGKSPSYSGSPPHTKNRSQSKERSPSENPNRNADERMTFDASRSPPQNLRDQKAHIERLGTIEEEEVKHAREGKDHINKSSQRTLDHSSGVRRRDSPERSGMGHRHDDSDFRKKEKGMRSEETSIKDLPATKPPHKGSFSSNRPETSHARDDAKADKKRSSRSKDAGGSLLGKSETVLKNKIVQENDPSVKFSGSEGSAEHKAGVAEKRKHKRSSRRETESDVSSYNSEVEERKVAKRRRKLEKILRKEERRRRREERRRRREEKRANKRKRKSKDSDSLPSDIEKNGDDAIASDERVARSGFQSSEKEETESEKKRLEIELREKALQSLRAKKGISH